MCKDEKVFLQCLHPLVATTPSELPPLFSEKPPFSIPLSSSLSLPPPSLLLSLIVLLNALYIPLALSIVDPSPLTPPPSLGNLPDAAAWCIPHTLPGALLSC